ncbi:MAG: DUF4437 domain-containing protein [Pseudomonadota bacterium]
MVLTPDQVDYIPLNPARGDAAPQAGTLWGDIREDVPSGVLLRFADGFSSPPHIHNITYRAVVIDGGLHNDDPDAAKMWMGPGSFWIQPAGEVHITAAQPGAPALSFLEITEGPYLVKPGEEAFDNGERPLNVDAGNMVWSDFGAKAEISYLWGDPNGDGLAGTLLRVPAGDEGNLSTDDGDLKAVVISGDIAHAVDGVSQSTDLGAGGYFASRSGIAHSVMCTDSQSSCTIYVRSAGTISFD